MIKFRHNDSLSKAATSHAKYLILNQVHGHYEKRDHYQFTGTTPSERVIQAGYPSTFVMENLSINAKGEEKSIDNLFAAIYHRFVFLDFDKDEIGIGNYTSKKKRRKHNAYVYNLGSSKVAKLCTKNFIMESGKFYMKSLCKNSEKLIPRELFHKNRDKIRRNNRNIVLYPFRDQTHIWPAFYRELPDPLPYYDVSGFPVSVQFNPAYFQDVELISFLLFDAEGNEVTSTKILHHDNDHNQLFTKLQFALMPLIRLDFSSKYTAEFSALADGKKIKKRWSFKTTELNEKLYTITKDHTHITMKAGEEIVIYLVPGSKKNIVNSYRSRGDIEVTFLDQNTLKVKAPLRGFTKQMSLDFGRRKVSFTVH